jgi:predicted aspartyl protease
LFRLALAGTGVGLLVVGLVALIENFDKVKDAINGTNDTSRALAGTLEATKTALGGAIEETTKVGNAFELARAGVISKEEALLTYNETLGGTFGKTNDLNVAEANYIKKKDAYIAATVARAQAQALLAESAVLSAEAATAKEEDVRSIGEKVLAFGLRASAQNVKVYSLGLVDVTGKVKEFNNEIRKQASVQVSTEKTAQAELRLNLFKSKSKEAEIIEASAGLIDENQQKVNDERDAKQKAANDKAIEAVKKAAEDQAKAREQLLKLEEDALIANLDAQSKILSDNNNKVLELEKTFAAAKFKAGSAEAIAAEQQLAKAIAEIRTNEAAQLAAIEKDANQKLFKDKLDLAKAAEGATLQQQLAALEEQQKIELSFADKLGLSELEIATRYATAIGKVKTDIAAAAIETQINELKTLEIEEGSSLERREQLIRLDAQKRIDAAKGDASAIKLINAETDQAITATRNEETNKQIALLEQYAAEVSNILGSLNEISQAQSQQRIADIEEASAKELEAINASSDLENDKIRSRDALAKRTAQRIAEEKTKQARQDKALALFEIGINTAKGFISALALTPPNPILAAFIAASGLAEAAVVASKPIPKFAQGGLIGGKLHSQGGTMIEAEQGEYMVNRRQSSKHRRELDAMNHSTEAFRKMIDEKYVRPALMSYSAGRRGKEGVTVNASLNSKSMEKELRGVRKDLKNRNVIVNINQQDSRYTWQ